MYFQNQYFEYWLSSLNNARALSSHILINFLVLPEVLRYNSSGGYLEIYRLDVKMYNCQTKFLALKIHFFSIPSTAGSFERKSKPK